MYPRLTDDHSRNLGVKADRGVPRHNNNDNKKIQFNVKLSMMSPLVPLDTEVFLSFFFGNRKGGKSM